MANAEEYRRQVLELVGFKTDRKGKVKEAKYQFAGTTPKEILSEIRQIQNNLRLIKKNVDLEIKNLRVIQTNRLNQIHPGLGAMLVFGKGSAKSMAAIKKKNVRAEIYNAIQPYELVKHLIDTVLVDLDNIKTRLSS